MPERRRCAAVIAACAVLAGCSSAGQDAGSGPRDVLTRTLAAGDRPAVPDLTGTSLEGREIHLSDYRGKVVLLNVWAHFCGPCRAEAPELDRIQREWSARGVQVLGIADDSSRTAALRFQQEHHLSYPSLHDPAGKQVLRLPHGLVSTQTIPFTVVVDPEGRAAAVRIGTTSETRMAKILTPLLPGPAKAAGKPEH
ncbi:TlpA family protein disulfide reductase [Streptomyces sp. NRRL S-340]|uniref:TlpA family protein disulfide reductase n=1 Tax=Streptomyces sp. NRRL S-340 TaxID=1463901 RepID=UPI00056AD2B7|nr:TlpA disulfide reductase family protein [Streptomyces sp. NRRL S-340]